MDASIFIDKTKKPTEEDLRNALANNYNLWQDVYDLVYLKYPNAVSEWNFPGQKHRWNFRMKDRKRTIVYLLPGDKRFLVAFVFGQRAFERTMSSNISKQIKHDLEATKVYA